MSEAAIKMGSDRSFGLVFAAVFAIIALYPLLGANPVRVWALPVSAVFGLASLIRPAALRPLNRLWFAFGMALGRVMTPVIMAVIFIVAVIPTGLVLRAFRKDPLNLRLDPGAVSYWEQRGAQPGSMREQF